MKRRKESGFALLFVLAMAAAIALALYIELPRVAFERQRDKEELLIERGLQYKRAIQLYFRKFKTYPTSLNALENTNNIRFLRRRYTDPLTGKDDWRLIHIGPGGVFTDSLTNKPKGDQKTENLNNFITEGQSLATPDPTSDQPTGPAFRRRPSEGGQPQPGGDPNSPQSAGLQPGMVPPALDPGAMQGQPAQPVTGQNPTPGFPGQAPQPGIPGIPPGQTPVSAFPGLPGVPVNPGSQQPGASPTDPNAPGTPAGNQGPYGQPGVNPGQLGSNQAADLINQLLRGPRPMPGSQPGMMPGGPQQITAGSIAGVASKVERRGIKVYNERNKYNEWEFIYDFSKDRTGAGQLANMMGGQQQIGQPQPGQQPGNIPGFGGPSGLAGAFGGSSNQPQPSSPGTGMQAGPQPPPSPPPQQ